VAEIVKVFPESADASLKESDLLGCPKLYKGCQVLVKVKYYLYLIKYGGQNLIKLTEGMICPQGID
jgi:hypothetical protein